MIINLTQAEIDAALPRVEKGLYQYLWLQGEVGASPHFHEDLTFRRKFNGFYRVRRGAEWQKSFYGVMACAAREGLGFQAVLRLLKDALDRYEASFASKLVATLDPTKPVIDAMVLKNLGLRLPAVTAPDRFGGICQIHGRIISMFAAYLSTESGVYLVNQFTTTYPDANVTKTKMLDLVLWQTRS